MEASAVAEAHVDVGRGVVEASTARGRETLRESTNGLVVRERDVRPLQAEPALDVHLVGAVDQHVGDVGHARSSGSSGPAPTTSRRSASCTASTVASPTGRPEARSASAT